MTYEKAPNPPFCMSCNISCVRKRYKATSTLPTCLLRSTAAEHCLYLSTCFFFTSTHGFLCMPRRRTRGCQCSSCKRSRCHEHVAPYPTKISKRPPYIHYITCPDIHTYIHTCPARHLQVSQSDQTAKKRNLWVWGGIERENFTKLSTPGFHASEVGFQDNYNQPTLSPAFAEPEIRVCR
ncbi:hypothetical protein P167DRAFT_166934 [Morchella conica CCBAS932]|uniref:Uncharacterized protein n=1 Tax=Morchella conica CCBAS932 TaxID=1392247 RepID=A0A3N4L2G9_9PEZI|nr:hypothetical protein P167DRAFT_166934 [Morchella conica CCBAS932]